MKLYAALLLALCQLQQAQASNQAHLQKLVGSHVIYSYNGPTPPPELQTLIEQGVVGGVILFGGNVNSDLPALIESWQTAYANSPAYLGSPLLIMTDQEGGKVRRLPGGPIDSEKVVGQSTDPEQAASQAGSDAASALAAYNINTNLAPVLDVFRTPGDFDDRFGRSYSNNATLAGICGGAFTTAQQGAGYIATAKHFPGLGTASTYENTDEVPVTLNVTIEEIRAVDELPYHNAIAAGIDMVMPSWALYPDFDDKYPSGLSEKWLKQELRGRLGFRGVTISDAIEAGALTAFGSDSERAVLASGAGMDIILAAAQNVTQGQTIVNALVDALNSGALNRGEFEQSTQRILRLRKNSKEKGHINKNAKGPSIFFPIFALLTAESIFAKTVLL
ncbi:glycosyl hydrolase, putative [Talaromyces stipitatus ATCC 10500]|uniref:Glycosyl hydrolase, putative n=1 Tax=Talaromyces stipitatus (strain ATCC 10500 / CBS 375.48 / QM 6759 / NRRL 1006) TaxID=441959 RepID=B8MG39_TALSN|nr:glycosyl hydrolase, putative [Talaromyces stipitatus ATCC 10500]EED15906.1 glycosyl hydrolase, putative [Talaromyces stipitatus ATCC 10500]